MKRLGIIAVLLQVAVTAFAGEDPVSKKAAATKPSDEIKPAKPAVPTAINGLLKKYCYECHDNTTATGKLSLESLPRQFSDHRWIRIHDKLAGGQMPPQDAKQPEQTERERLTSWLQGELHKASLALQQTEGRVVLRRLNRTEYETTLRDLLGIQVEVKDLLPGDNSAAGFDNVSAVLDVSSVHLLRYQDTAEKALQTVIPRELPATFRARLTGREIVEKSKQSHEMIGKSLRLDGDTLLLYVQPYNHVALGTATVSQAGRYRVRASVYAVGTQGEPLPVKFSAGKEWGRDENDVRAVLDAPADKPTVIDDVFELKPRDLIDVHAWSLPTDRKFREDRRNHGQPLDKYAGPGLAVQWLEIEGPLSTETAGVTRDTQSGSGPEDKSRTEPGVWPPVGYTRLFGDLPLKPKWKNGPLFVDSTNPRADVKRLMRSFLPLAFRRPVSPELEDYYVKVVLAALEQKLSFEDAMLLGYRAALCSPHFLFLTEQLEVRENQTPRLDDYAVAARLSYFLWSTFPDSELIQLAAKGELTRPDVIRAQVERMLKDSRSHRFTENFAGQWLDLRQLNATTPDPDAYGEFDGFLFWSMPRETELFFERVLREDRNLTEFVHSDWTYLNERLARHYGIPGVFGGELRLVQLPPDCHRGGILTHASIMKVTADGTKTSPVLRGKWVLERILGQPPAPPPPDVTAIEPDIRGATTIRQQLDKHRNTQACASCHRHIDPPGFALESFDVIGGWREFYRGTVYKREAVVELANYPGRQIIRGPDVEKGGETPDGRPFKNIDEYKQILLRDKDQLARNMAEKLLIYATGADIQFADREVVEQLVTKSRTQNYGFRSLIHDVVQSRIFLSK